jgi:hypothetical protein
MITCYNCNKDRLSKEKYRTGQNRTEMIRTLMIGQVNNRKGQKKGQGIKIKDRDKDRTGQR